MKRFLFLLVATTLLAVVGKAQFPVAMPLVAGDSVVNGATVNKTIGIISTGYEGIVIQVRGVKNTGTVGGTIGIYGSLDGTNYDLIGSAFTATDVATNVKSFYITAPVPAYLQVRWTGTGTMNAVLRVSYVIRRHD